MTTLTAAATHDDLTDSDGTSQIAKAADWLLDAIATATQNRMYLRGDPQFDAVACEAITSNARKVMIQLLSDQAASAEAAKADVKRLAALVAKLTTCDCGKTLSRGLCSRCDNDE